MLSSSFSPWSWLLFMRPAASVTSILFLPPASVTVVLYYFSSNHVRIINPTYAVTNNSSLLWHIISKFLKTAGKFCFMHSEIALLSCCLYYYLSLIKAYHYCKYSKVLLHLEVLLTESATGNFLRILWQLKSTSPISFYGTTESGASSYFLILFSS